MPILHFEEFIVSGYRLSSTLQISKLGTSADVLFYICATHIQRPVADTSLCREANILRHLHKKLDIDMH